MKRNRTGLIIGIFAIGFVAVLLYLTMSMGQHRVEVCMTFHGRTECRVASGETRQEALRAATENACALIASGVTDTIACQNTPPVSVRWLDCGILIPKKSPRVVPFPRGSTSILR